MNILCLLLTTTLALAHGYEPTVPESVVRETKTLLAEIIALDTSNPPGNELKVAERVKPLLEEAGIETRVFESAPGRGNLWARLKGSGKKRPLFITAHTDVVGAVGGGWTSDPFKLVERDGHYYGRGVIDDKGMGAAAVAVIRHLARSKVQLERDIILFLGADEESGSTHGIVWMLEHHPELIDAEVVLNEGGGIGIEDGAMTQAAVQLYEKLYMDVTVTVTGESGHSSVPSRDNSVTRLARAVERIGAYEFPVRLNPVTRAYFKGLGELERHPLKDAFAVIGRGKPGKDFDAAAAKASESPFYNAQLRTTCTPTVIKAGFRSNAIPGQVEATVNCRLLPDETREDILSSLSRAIGDPKVVLAADAAAEPAMSPFEDPFFDVVRGVMKEMAPEAVTVPYMSAGATDSRKLRLKGLKAYGLVPYPMTAEDKGRMHGDNERVRVSSVDFGVEFLYRLIVRYAGR